ncbi:MAG: carbonic anhydrase [Oscillatoriales cyanobacterium SM2_1_8]|nr:carbonic anhydrase [Oscillatoriales cyanobacterium SM2_1_8]
MYRDLIEGLRDFRTRYFCTHADLFERLAHGQKPGVLFITCSDSRIDPNLMFQAELGELFVIRNAGNIVPPYGAANGGEGATIEYALRGLNIQDIVICGHSHCGAMKGLLKLDHLEQEMPLVYEWLQHTQATRRYLLDRYGDRHDAEMVELAVQENVLTQLENLRTYPEVQSRLRQGKLNLYGWVFEIETGLVFAYDPAQRQFLPIDNAAIACPAPAPPRPLAGPWAARTHLPRPTGRNGVG